MEAKLQMSVEEIKKADEYIKTLKLENKTFKKKIK
jgi:hypothetical protein